MNVFSPLGARRMKTDLRPSDAFIIRKTEQKPIMCVNQCGRFNKWFNLFYFFFFSTLYIDYGTNCDLLISYLFTHSSQLPARSTRLLNRSRLQHTNLNGTESPRSIENLNLIHKTASQFGRDSANGSPDEQLFMLDKTLRNSMIQDVQYCKQQLLQLRSILQEVSVALFALINVKIDCTLHVVFIYFFFFWFFVLVIVLNLYLITYYCSITS